MDRPCPVRKLTQESFRPYGSVIDIPEAVQPTFKADFFTYYDSVASVGFDGDISFSILTVTPRDPYLATIEKHGNTPEVMVATDRDVSFIVALSGDTTVTRGTQKDVPDPETAQAFLLQKGRGVVMSPGVWHWVPFSEEGETRIVFIYKRGTVESEDVLSVDLVTELDLRFEVQVH